MIKYYFANVRERKVDASGNTYHDIELYDNKGNLIAGSKRNYGGGSMYRQTAESILDRHLPLRGYKPIHYESGYHASKANQAIREGKIVVHYFVHYY